MSFEGYHQILCANGHYHSHDVYSDTDDDETERCTACGAELVWFNIVDCTNGEEDGYVILKEHTPAVWKMCDLGHKHIVTPAAYDIPTTSGYRKR